MATRFLAWYSSTMFAVGTFLSLFVSISREAQYHFLILQAILAVLALVFAVIGVVLQWLPRHHWLNRSIGVRSVLVITAVSGSLFLMAVVG